MSEDQKPLSALSGSLEEARPTDLDESELFVAGQWQLMWWRFRRHKLALIATSVVLLFYLICLMPEFLSVHEPRSEESTRAYIPPQGIHFFDGWKPQLPFVYGLIGERNQETRAMEWTADKEVKRTIKYFANGHEYEWFGLVTSNTHLFGLDYEVGKKDPVPLYFFGSDRMGRDVWSRIMYGTRVSMSIGLVAVVLMMFLGILLGGLSGLRGGMTDLIIQRIIEFLRAIPTIPLWLALAASVPADWGVLKIYFSITVIISLIEWTRLAREVRGRFLSMREEDFVVASRLYGSSEIRIIFRQMLPSFYSHIIASTTLAIPAIILSETALSFLGLGIRPPAISWGVLLFEAQTLQAVAKAGWLMIPGLFVLVSILCMNFMGDGLRDAADPYA
jgi:peptide/nickel transport system permease protein